MKITNYGKTWSFYPSAVLYPESKEALQEIVKSSQKIRVKGSKHSWSKGIITEDTLISLDKMSAILTLDKEKNQARIQCGKTLKAIKQELEQEGYAFINLGSIDDQTLAGAICTATHGTGFDFQCLASQVESFKLIDGEGNDREYNTNDEEFYAIITGFGSYGVIYEMLLNVVPSFQMKALTDTTSFNNLIENLESYVEKNDHFKFWWLAPDQDVIIFENNRTTEPRNDSDLQRFFKDELVAVLVYRTLIAIGKINRKQFIPPINRFLTKEVGKRFERIIKSYVSFLTPVPPVHRETEWAFDYKDAKRLLTEFRELLPSEGHTYNFVQEIRFTKADQFWLSPAYNRTSIWLSMYNIAKNQSWNAQLDKFEKWAKKNGGRPHWGKEATLDSQYLNKQYTKLGDFGLLMKKLDPQRKFVNKWIQEII